MDHEFKRNVMTAVNNRDDIVFVLYSLIDDTEDKIRYSLLKLLTKYRIESFFTPLISCIKELIANATKANSKHILVKEGAISDPENTENVVSSMRSILNNRGILQYGIKCKEYRLSTRLYLKSTKQGPVIQVTNNLPLQDREMKKIEGKMKQASKYDSIAEFFIDNPDPEAEGMGLGISMIVVLLKNINIPSINFRVTTDGTSKTTARILIPVQH